MMLSVVIPVYNEQATLAQLIQRVRAVPLDKHLILVDDFSTDGTRDLLKQYEGQADCTVVYHDHNQGKGSALRTGLAQQLGELVIFQDADMEYDPAEYPTLVKPILDGKADVVYGSRFSGGESHRVLGFWHSKGNKLLTMLSNMFTNLNLTDMETGYKVFKREVIKQITLEEDRFGIEPEITAKVSRLKGIKIYEVGISYDGRTYAEGKKIGWRDGLRAVWCIFKYNVLRS